MPTCSAAWPASLCLQAPLFSCLCQTIALSLLPQSCCCTIITIAGQGWYFALLVPFQPQQDLQPSLGLRFGKFQFQLDWEKSTSLFKQIKTENPNHILSWRTASLSGIFWAELLNRSDPVVLVGRTDAEQDCSCIMIIIWQWPSYSSEQRLLEDCLGNNNSADVVLVGTQKWHTDAVQDCSHIWSTGQNPYS